MQQLTSAGNHLTSVLRMEHALRQFAVILQQHAARQIDASAPLPLPYRTPSAAGLDWWNLPTRTRLGFERYGELSGAHQAITMLAKTFHTTDRDWGASDTLWWRTGGADDEDTFKRQWIYDHRQVIEVAARTYGIPDSLLAGVAYVEIGGKPTYLDDAVDVLRQQVPAGAVRHALPYLSAPPDHTSYGPMSIQIRRAADALGYDPDTIAYTQRDAIIGSLKDHRQSLFIAAKHLADLKLTTDFATVPPGQLSTAQEALLAAKYNAGPDKADSSGYGDGQFLPNRARAVAALSQPPR